MFLLDTVMARGSASRLCQSPDHQSNFFVFSFLGMVDLYGTAFEDTTIATGYGAYLARPLLRKAYRADLSEDEARKILEDCMRVLFYRDARAINRIQIAKVCQPLLLLDSMRDLLTS